MRLVAFGSCGAMTGASSDTAATAASKATATALVGRCRRYATKVFTRWLAMAEQTHGRPRAYSMPCSSPGHRQPPADARAYNPSHVSLAPEDTCTIQFVWQSSAVVAWDAAIWPAWRSSHAPRT